MPLFVYRARDPNGLLVTGELESSPPSGGTPAAVKLLLSNQGLIPISVENAKGQLQFGEKFAFGKKVSPQDLVMMTRQFYTLFKAGMSMESLLGTLSKQTKNKFLSETLQQVRTAVQGGSTLGKAFAKHPKVFSELYVSMMSAGEEAGILEVVLAQLSSLLEKEEQLKSNVKSATLYPKIVLFVLLMASIVILTFVMPKFASFYGHYKAELPLPTRLLMVTSDLMRRDAWIIALVSFGLWRLFKRYYRTAKGHLRVDRLRWKIPVFGSLGQKVANARFSHVVAALYKSGMSITRALTITEGIMDNEAFRRDIRGVVADVERGQSISDAMRRTQYFAPIVIEATAIGEKTGSLDTMLEGLGAHYDEEVAHTLKNLTTLLEPFLLFFIFGMVAVFALAIFLPIWNMSKVVGGGG